MFLQESIPGGIASKIDFSNRENFRKIYIQQAIDKCLIELRLSDKPNNSKQK